MNVRLLRKRREPPPHPVLRMVRIAAGSSLVFLGLIFSFMPVVPQIPFFLAGLWLMSADVRLARRALMRVRIWGRQARRRYHRYRHGHAQHEGRLPVDRRPDSAAGDDPLR